MLVVDFTQETSRGPPRAHRIDAAKVIAELEQAALKTSIVDIGLPDQYAIKASR